MQVVINCAMADMVEGGKLCAAHHYTICPTRKIAAVKRLKDDVAHLEATLFAGTDVLTHVAVIAVRGFHAYLAVIRKLVVCYAIASVVLLVTASA